MTNLRTVIARNRLLKPARKPARRRSEEHDFQTVAVDHLELVLPPTAICFSIDHANARNALAGALRKRRGVLPGIPDVFVTWSADPASRLSVILWLETKATRGVLSVDQEAFRVAALALGQYWAAPRTLEEVDAALRGTPIPIRAVRLLPAGASFVTPHRV